MSYEKGKIQPTVNAKKKINTKERNKIINYIVKFAEKNPSLRIFLDRKIKLNVATTGDVYLHRPQSNPTVSDIQELEVNSATGLPFETIAFYDRDARPLATIAFKDTSFTIKFRNLFDRRVVDFFEQINQMADLHNPHTLSKMWRDEKVYKQTYLRLGRAVHLVESATPDKKETIKEIWEEMSKVQKLKENGDTSEKIDK